MTLPPTDSQNHYSQRSPARDRRYTNLCECEHHSGKVQMADRFKADLFTNYPAVAQKLVDHNPDDIDDVSLFSLLVKQ